MKKKPVILFLAICFAISLTAAGLFHFLGGEYSSVLGSLFASAYMFIPLVSVIITQLIIGEAPLSNCGVSFKFNWWWLFGILAMPVFVLLTLPVASLFPGVSVTAHSEMLDTVLGNMNSMGLSFGPWGYYIITFISGIFAAATVNALFAFGEEVAWRGFLSRCLERLGFWKKSLLVGAIWGVWHAPIILMGHNFPDHPVAGVFMMIAFCVLFAPVIQFFRDKAKSVVAAAMVHGSLNAFAGICLLCLVGYKDLLCSCCGVAGIVVLIVADLILALKIKE